MKKRYLIPLVIAVVAGVAYGGHRVFSGAPGDDGSTLSGVTVKRGNIDITVTAQGTLEPKNYVDVATQVSGQLKKLHADIGYIVKEGDLLAEIDPRLYQSALDANEAKLLSLNAELEKQKAQTVLADGINKRNKSLAETGAIAKEVYEQSQAEYDVALAEIKSLEAQIKEIGYNIDKDKTNLGYTKIYAPMSGTVVDRNVKEGETLNAVQSAPVLFRIADLDVMTVRAQAAEADVGQLKEGIDVYFTTLGNQDKKWQGKIRQILPTPQIENDVVLYDVLVDVANPTHELMISMTTQVYFSVETAKDVLTVPLSVLKDRAGQDTYKVSVVTSPGAKPEERIIKSGLRNRTEAEITEGLNESDTVIIPSSESQDKKKVQLPPGMGGAKL